MTAGTAERDGQIALPFLDVMREQIYEELRDTLDELHRLREGADVACHLRMPSAELLELRDVVGIGQESDIEHEVAIGRHAVTEAEARDVDDDVRFVAAAVEFLADNLGQLRAVEVGGVEDVIGERADGLERALLGADAAQNGTLTAQRMRAPGLTIPAHQRVVVRFEEHQRDLEPPLQGPDDGRELLQLFALADVHNQGSPPRSGAVARELRELGYQVDGQIVDGVVAEVFERTKNSPLPRAAQRGNDDQVRASVRRCLGGARLILP